MQLATRLCCECSLVAAQVKIMPVGLCVIVQMLCCEMALMSLLCSATFLCKSVHVQALPSQLECADIADSGSEG